MRYTESGGLTMEGQSRREQVWLQAAAMSAKKADARQVARELRVRPTATPSPLDRDLRNLTPARRSSSSCRAVKEDTPSVVGSRFPPSRCRHLSHHSPCTRDIAVPAP